MKQKIIPYLLIVAMMIFAGIDSLSAIPKYTDKETALKLAQVLDKGTFGRYAITSTYVLNDSLKDYYISAILSNGKQERWYINQIAKWTRDDKIKLAQNKNLLFLNPRDAQFEILDKNQFHKLALQANIYRKVFLAGDPLEGQEFRFKIKSFNLISPLETAFGRNIKGSKYRYILDLFNGMRELLTYEDAYRLLQENRLEQDSEDSHNVFGKVYHVTKITAQPKGRLDNGVSQFGIEIEFAEPIQLGENHFPYEIYERKRPGRSGKTKSDFILDITIPNSVKRHDIQPIYNLEYLRDIKVIPNPKFPKRLLLRAKFNPMVLDIPPVVYKNSDKTVYVSFFNMIDQSVLSRGMLLEANKRKEAERLSIKSISIPKTMKDDSDYGRAFISGVELEKESLEVKGVDPKIERMLESISKFEEAALFAEADTQLYNALSRRNRLRETIISLTLDNVRGTLKQNSGDFSDTRLLLDQLDRAESFTGNALILKQIEDLREKVMANQ